MKTLLVDDHVLVLEGLRKFLAANGFEIVGTARNGADALSQFAALRPDLVLMDLQMPGLNGILTTRMIKEKYPETKIVILTAIEDDKSLLAAIQAGAEGYLLKDMEPENFISQLVGLSTGEMPLAPGLAGRLLRTLSRRQQKDDRPQPELTERQVEILQLLAEGLIYKEIGTRLNLKEVTVRYHIKEMLAKTQMTNKAQLLVHAMRFGLDGKSLTDK
jgi:DNA-binding NarL/FixJ family response regulator